MSRSASRYGASARRNVVMGVLAVLGLLLMARLLYLQIYSGAFLLEEGYNRSLRVFKEDALRGMILDREGEPLAISTPISSVVVDPKVFWSTLRGDFDRQRERCLSDAVQESYCQWINSPDLSEEVALVRYQYLRLEPMAQLLNLSVDELYRTLEERQKRRFYYLKRQLPPGLVDEVVALNLPGVSGESTYQRFYPSGEVLGQIIGFTDIEDQGQEGVELAFNSWLAGQPGRVRYLQGKNKNTIEVVEEEVPASPGAPLQLSVDKRIQYITHQVMSDAMAEFQADSVSAVVVEVKTGEVLAMVSLPDGNPNNSAERIPELMKNRVITDVFEPGSTIKPIVMAAALDAGVITEKTVFPTRGNYYIGRNVVRDTKNYGTLDSIGVIRKSSNVGMAMISQRLPREKYQSFMQSIGFGRLSGIEFPGEQRGIMHNPKNLGDFAYATTSFGYGISVTALQLVHAYAALANDGVQVPLTLLKRQKAEAGRRIMSEQTALSVRKMLKEAVSNQGTGRRSNTENYTVAGKTGTSHKIIDGRYAKNRYRGVFAGYAPADNPKIAVVVVVDDPKRGGYYGGVVAAPSFAKITEWSLKMLGVLPDKIGQSGYIELDIDQEVFASEANELEAIPDAPI